MSDERVASPTARAGTYVLAAVIGVIYGAVATVGHRHALRIGDVVIPWGLVAALAGVLALLLGIRIVAGGRWTAAAAAVGIIGVVSLLTLPGRGGSVLVTGDVLGTIWAVCPALIAVLVVAWPKIPLRRSAADGGA